MTYALSWSGGKDSTLALDRALAAGLPVRYVFNIYHGPSGRVPFHGVRSDLIAAQAEALGLQIVQRATGDQDFEAVFLRTLSELADHDVRGVIFGNIHLADVRGWYEERTTRLGFEHVEPLWSEPPGELIREFVDRGHRALIVSVDEEAGEPEWLGRPLDASFVDAVLAHPTADPCGERGEFHSFVSDGPLFRHPVNVRPGATRARQGHRLLDLLPAP